MQGLGALWEQSDGVGRAVALLLLAMSITAWVLILWRSWLLRRVAADITRAVPAFWAADTLATGRARLVGLDREQLLLPLLDASTTPALAGALESAAPLKAQLTRRLRDALHAGLAHLQTGQVMLASIGSTAPFIGLFGTVWGVYHALAGMAEAGGVSIEKVSGPIGEALVMTAAGIAVAVPAVLAFNAFGQRIAACEAELEGFAHDLREMVLGPARGQALGPAREAAPPRGPAP